MSFKWIDDFCKDLEKRRYQPIKPNQITGEEFDEWIHQDKNYLSSEEFFDTFLRTIQKGIEEKTKKQLIKAFEIYLPLDFIKRYDNILSAESFTMTFDTKYNSFFEFSIDNTFYKITDPKNDSEKVAA